jgi:hypothetical protein
MSQNDFPAFPRPSTFYPGSGEMDCPAQQGMDYREFVASLCMAAATAAVVAVQEDATKADLRGLARLSVAAADALLARLAGDDAGEGQP